MTRRIAGLALLTAGLVAAPPPAHAGPPWIGIEIPANPLHESSRGALLLVHAYHHGTAMAFPVTGTAEGLVGGQRRTVTLAFTRAVWDGVYALRYDVPAQGVWILVINVMQSEQDGATAIVRIKNGEVVGVRVPMGTERTPRRVTTQDVDEALRAHARDLAAEPRGAGTGLALLGGLAMLGVVGLVGLKERR
ncbi:MAG: hypothetical protein ACREMR_02725 [Gemmatimonadales bacterium]